jgi:hypothetical protein
MSELIRLEFLMGPDWQSRAIAQWGQGPNGWSHCASLLKDGRYLDARDDVIGGVEPGIHIRDPAEETWVRKRSASKAVTAEVYAAWEANLKAKIGDAYAKRDIIGMIANKMLHRPGTYDCSALAINALQHVKLVPFPLVIPAHEITPNVALIIVQVAGFDIGEVIQSPSAPPNLKGETP